MSTTKVFQHASLYEMSLKPGTLQVTMFWLSEKEPKRCDNNGEGNITAFDIPVIKSIILQCQ